MTGVGRDNRGRGLATAIKVEALARTKQKACARCSRRMTSPNKAMRKVNAKLGYEALPAHVQLERPL
jgi:RimJ/RimL family protein N-acetyltransferase